MLIFNEGQRQKHEYHATSLKSKNILIIRCWFRRLLLRIVLLFTSPEIWDRQDCQLLDSVLLSFNKRGEV